MKSGRQSRRRSRPYVKVRRSDSDRGEARPQLPVAAPPRCDFCQLGENCNKYGTFETLLYCKECTAKAHPSCMEYTEELAQRAQDRPWQCIDCKTCIVCKDPGDPDQMLFCDGCDRGYHMTCHSPKVTQNPGAENEKWICSSCVAEGVTVKQLEQEEQKMKAKKQSLPNPKPHTPAPEKKPFMEAPCVSPVAGDEASNHNGSAMNGRVEPEQSRRTVLSRLPVLEGGQYPDASDWSIEDVVSFFRSTGFEDQCDAFRQQEIDGRSLLLMKRNDVLTGLAIKLGPALKINRHVQGLQAAYQNSFH